jgi:hypothetical protein
MYQDYYFANFTAEQLEDNLMHTYHCIDLLRQSIMCQGDINLITLRWGQKQALPIGNTSSPHECVNWDGINGWAKERSIERALEPGYIKHPTFGTSIKGDFDGRLGVVHDD